MKFNFNSELSRDKGVLLFVCLRNEPMHNYLTNLDQKNSNYIATRLSSTCRGRCRSRTLSPARGDRFRCPTDRCWEAGPR